MGIIRFFFRQTEARNMIYFMTSNFVGYIANSPLNRLSRNRQYDFNLRQIPQILNIFSNYDRSVPLDQPKKIVIGSYLFA